MRAIARVIRIAPMALVSIDRIAKELRGENHKRPGAEETNNGHSRRFSRLGLARAKSTEHCARRRSRPLPDYEKQHHGHRKMDERPLRCQYRAFSPASPPFDQ